MFVISGNLSVVDISLSTAMTINFGAQQLFVVYLFYPFVYISVKRSMVSKTMMNSAIDPCVPLYWPAASWWLDIAIARTNHKTVRDQELYV